MDSDEYEEAMETGLPVGTCGYCGGAHYATEHATDGELAQEARDAERDETPEPPDDWYDDEA